MSTTKKTTVSKLEKTKKHIIELTDETYKLLQQVKKAFVSYTGEGLEERSDSKVIDVLTGGFFDSMVRGEVEGGACGGWCGCDDESCGDDNNNKKECCGGKCGC